MSHLKFVFLFLVSSLILTSCQKDGNNKLADSTEAIQSFTIGDYNQVRVDSGQAGEPLYSFNDISFDIEQNLDVDQDGKDDFRFQYKPYHNLSGGQKVTVSLICLNSNIEVAASAYTDSSKICYAQSANYDSVFFNTAGSYNCQSYGNSVFAWIPDYGNASVHSSPDVFIAGDQPNAQLNWHSDSLLLKTEDKSSAMHRRALYQVERGEWVRANNKYLLFRQNTNGNIHYGWMKLSVDDLFHFEVEEVAFQKN